tara:strand:+ start:74 stop:316 length:243 start_codon:yes stop_codon:yes gene_type:complete
MDFQLKNCIVRHVNFPECEKCDLAKDMLKDLGIRFDILTCDKQGFGQITRVTKSLTVPQIFLDGEFVGGYDELVKHFEKE